MSSSLNSSSTVNAFNAKVGLWSSQFEMVNTLDTLPKLGEWQRM